MPMHSEFINGMHEVRADDWNQLAGSHYPFLRHEFLLALEQSGAASPLQGWRAQHLLIYQEDELLAACPLYIKNHSQGEFIFDQQWAGAYQEHGFSYFPKAVTAIPFTPCAAERILFSPDVNKDIILKYLLNAIQQHANEQLISSWHCLFSDPNQTELLQHQGLIIREGVQYQWFNRGYRDFQDYLQHFSARKRKNTLKERELVKAQGIEFISLSGAEVSESQWQVFFDFYRMTYLKHGMSGYLNLEFFLAIALSMPTYIRLIFAVKANRYVGAALSFVGSDTLYGRYWGCFEEYRYLHFETCYYQGLDYCLAQGLARFDSGAQGEHKIARGFEPISTYSAHWLQNPQFAHAIQRFCAQEKEWLANYRREATALLPFKQVNE